jgi:hypothetical protein
MEKKVKKIINAAKNDKNFQFELKKHEPNNYKLDYFSNDTEKIIYASIYMGWLIGKGVYDESVFV